MLGRPTQIWMGNFFRAFFCRSPHTNNKYIDLCVNIMVAANTEALSNAFVVISSAIGEAISIPFNIYTFLAWYAKRANFMYQLIIIAIWFGSIFGKAQPIDGIHCIDKLFIRMQNHLGITSVVAVVCFQVYWCRSFLLTFFPVCSEFFFICAVCYKETSKRVSLLSVALPSSFGLFLSLSLSFIPSVSPMLILQITFFVVPQMNNEHWTCTWVNKN